MLLTNYHLLMPEIYLTTIVTFLLTFGVFFSKVGGRYNKFYKFNFLAVLTLIWTFIILATTSSVNTEIIGAHNLLVVNSLNIYVKGIILLASLGVYWLTWNSYSQYKINDYEYSLLILLSILGLLIIVTANDLLLIYLAVELISLSLYVLAGIRRTRALSTEAGLKYFVLGALSSGILLFGMAIIYNTSGTTNLTDIGLIADNSTGIKIGGIFIVTALLFKLAAAPLHMWAPDVYEGAPTVVTSYFAIVPKVGLLYVLYTIINTGLISIYDPVIKTILMTTAILSIGVGTFGAIAQNRIVRLMAYSAIAHMGFILLGFASGTLDGIVASFVYILIYIIMSINTFSIIFAIYKGGENKYIGDIRGLGRNHPILAISLAITLLSIAGIPPLAGFFSKFYVILSVIETNYIILAITAIVLSVVASYYYIRIIKSMYFEESSIITTTISHKITKGQGIIIGATMYLIMTILLNPKPVLMITMEMIINTIV